jgi:hypothetical protein
VAERSLQRAQAMCAWSDEEVIEDLKTSSLLTNPCIKLDSGAVVWGMECWWAEADRVRAKLDAWKAQGAEITLVQLPDDRFDRVRVEEGDRRGDER